MCYEDLVYPKILSLLSYRDWLSLRCVSKKCNGMVEAFFMVNRALPVPIPSEKLFHILTDAARKLRILKINDSAWITDEVLKPVLLRNRKLKCLDLTNCTKLSEGIMQVLTVNCLEVERLLVGGCPWITPCALDYHIIHHKRIKTSNQYPSNVMDPLEAMGSFGLRSKVPERKRSKYCGKDDLYLKLKSPGRVSKIKRKSEKKTLGRKLGTLLEIDFSGNFTLDDSILMKLFNHFNQITSLNINSIPQLTDNTMKHIGLNLLSLKYLDISLNGRISDRGLYTVAKYCTQLKAVNIKRCIGITDISIKFLREKKISIISDDMSAPLSALPFQPFLPLLPSYLVESSDSESEEEEGEAIEEPRMQNEEDGEQNIGGVLVIASAEATTSGLSLKRSIGSQGGSGDGSGDSSAKSQRLETTQTEAKNPQDLQENTQTSNRNTPLSVRNPSAAATKNLELEYDSEECYGMMD